MKKQILATATVLTLTFSMLTGCGGSSKDDYLDDVDELCDVLDKNLEDAEDALPDMDIKTSEGEACQDALEEYLDFCLDYEDETLYDMDEDDLEELQKITEDVCDTLDSFIDAAKDAGVDKDDLKDLKDMLNDVKDFLKTVEDML